ncbi:MAG TPA: efflux transporter periplasmic adaptor subunit [Bacteroidetes bacterium]|nr:efflux transporter periplasmic adaptor subunit [Bacteroidota bacterium]
MRSLFIHIYHESDHMNNRLRITLIIIIPVIFIGAFLLRNVFLDDISEPTLQTTQTQNTPTSNSLGVRALKLNAQSFSNNIFTTGTIIANEEVQLRPETSGRITSLTLDEGRSVKKGDLLVKINDADLQAQLLRARLQLELAELRENRQKLLLENRAIAQEDYDVALNQVNTIKAEISLIEAQIEKTELRAPFDGVIGLRNVSEGSYITTSNVVATLQDFNTIKIDFSIPERYSALVQSGDQIRFTRQASEGTYEGKIMAIEPRIDQATRTLVLRAQAPNPNRSIIPGAFVQIEFKLREIPNALMVPSEAIIPELGGNSVFIYEGGSAVRKRVIIGTRTETLVQVVDGLSDGDTILTTGILQLREGMPVRVTEMIDQTSQES